MLRLRGWASLFVARQERGRMLLLKSADLPLTSVLVRKLLMMLQSRLAVKSSAPYLTCTIIFIHYAHSMIWRSNTINALLFRRRNSPLYIFSLMTVLNVVKVNQAIALLRSNDWFSVYWPGQFVFKETYHHSLNL